MLSCVVDGSRGIQKHSLTDFFAMYLFFLRKIICIYVYVCFKLLVNKVFFLILHNGDFIKLVALQNITIQQTVANY